MPAPIRRSITVFHSSLEHARYALVHDYYGIRALMRSTAADVMFYGPSYNEYYITFARVVARLADSAYAIADFGEPIYISGRDVATIMEVITYGARFARYRDYHPDILLDLNGLMSAEQRDTYRFAEFCEYYGNGLTFPSPWDSQRATVAAAPENMYDDMPDLETIPPNSPVYRPFDIVSDGGSESVRYRSVDYEGDAEDNGAYYEETPES